DPLAFACVIIRPNDTLAGRLGRVFETLRVNDTSGVPVWIQIRNHMIFLIRSGALEDQGDTLPTVRELAIQLGVNYNTIHKVYQDLETDGLILSGRGKRSTIAEIDREALDLPDSPVDVVIEELVRVVRETGVSRADAMTRIEEAFAKLEDR
ncbi:MAG: GntR family transcriptional regulator, partial [Gordonibacter pamelaeae]